MTTSDTVPGEQLDLHTTAGKIADLERRRYEAVRRHRGRDRRRAPGGGVLPAGGAVYSPAVTDFTLMVEGTSHMFITGPDVIKTVTGEDVTMEELGGAHTHASRSGVAHYQAADEEDCIEYARLLLSYLPSNNLEEPPALPAVPDLEVSEADEALDALIPDSPNQPYDIHRVIEAVVDDGEFTEVSENFARNIVTGFGRVAGMPVGVVANQPMHLAGCLDIDASEKAARFVRTCDAFSVPVLTFVDVPGFLPGTSQEYEDTLANPYTAAERGYIDAVIRPAETRTAVTRALLSLRTKRETLPPKKHGNIPL